MNGTRERRLGLHPAVLQRRRLEIDTKVLGEQDVGVEHDRAPPQGSAPRVERQDKRVKFAELAENRTINAIRAIRVIGKLANKSAYEYDDTDVKKITNALSKEIESLKARMTSKNGKDEVGFKL
jgi:hypothetical protein